MLVVYPAINCRENRALLQVLIILRYFTSRRWLFWGGAEITSHRAGVQKLVILADAPFSPLHAHTAPILPDTPRYTRNSLNNTRCVLLLLDNVRHAAEGHPEV